VGDDNFIGTHIVKYLCGLASVGRACKHFSLCGICFKKNKIVGAIAILFGISTLMSLLGGLIIPHLDLEQIFSNFDAVDEQTAARWLAGIMNASVAFTCLLTIGLGWGVWRRIKTLQH
jgi:hypothetical protein